MENILKQEILQLLANVNVTQKGNEQAADKLYALISDASVAFKEWCDEDAVFQEVGYMVNYGKPNELYIETTQELFDYFISNIYKHGK